MAWIYLLIAGLLEIVWAFFMKQSDGFTKTFPTVMTLVTAAASFGLLSVSMKTLPLGTAYVVWTGVGAVGAFLLGIAFLGEAASVMRIAAGSLIIAGLVLMKLSTPV
ncbi:MAG: multidrug efflux SMR transporter [Proteobacteria bacterium]|nr:multidrug efflux SMR transporter [Pseudomonadota bacterium]